MITEPLAYAYTTSGGAVKLSDREGVLKVLANPDAYGTDAKFAIQVLLECSKGDTTFNSGRSHATTLDVTNEFNALVDLFTDPGVWFENEPYCSQPDIPQFVPADWVASLNVRSVEDTSFRLPWLDGVDD